MAVSVLVTVLALVQFLIFGVLVGRARERYKVPAPAMSGNDIFERYFRVQMNTLELLIIFVPALWMASAFVAPLWIALLGAVYLVGRVLYLSGYVADPKKRSAGFGLSALPIVALLLIDTIGAIARLIKA